MPSAFITGCASGFGHGLAVRLLSEGWRVIASDAETLDGVLPRSERLECHRLDVRDASQVTAAAEAVGEVDLLVNNAGYALFGTQEEVDVEAVRDLFDVNVLGPVRVTRALLPALRRSRGTIVQISSVAGRTAFPESGFYAATKHAVEALSESLFQEVCTFGVRVRVVEPGSFATRFLQRAAEVSPVPPASSPYAGLRDVWGDRKTEVLEPPQDPALVVDAIVASLADPAPFLRVVVGPDAQRVLALREGLGPDAWTRLAGDRNGLSRPHGPGEVLSPEEVLSLSSGDAALHPARLAAQHGHLAHWTATATGRAALAHLSGSTS